MNQSERRDTAYHIRLLADHVPSMLAYWDRDLLCRFANRAYERWFGVDPDSLIGTSIRDLLGPELYALNEPHITAALAGREQVFERIVPGPGGVRRHSLAHYIPDFVDGEVMGFMVEVTDVSRLKQTEAALRAEIAQREHTNQQLRGNETMLREAQRLGQIGSWEWEIESDIVTWSDELYRIFGREPNRLPPPFAGHAGLFTADSWSRLASASAVTIETGQPYQLQLAYPRPQGDMGWLEARGEGVRDEHGAVIKLRGTVHEITLQRQMDGARMKLQIAEAASQNKTRLLSRVSHELRTPLHGILGFAQLMLADARLDPKHRQWMELIVRSGRHMQDLVDEILDLSSAELDRIVVHNTQVDLCAVVRESLLQVSGMATDVGVGLLSRGVDGGSALVQGDAKRLKQVVDNMLSNALKYTRSGGLVTVSVDNPGTGGVELTVADTGIGMTDEQVARLFTPFERLGAEHTAIQGAGVGLALAKKLVELMGGSIRATSRPGDGSAFVVTLRPAAA